LKVCKGFWLIIGDDLVYQIMQYQRMGFEIVILFNFEMKIKIQELEKMGL
jgi:hypothetical protein